jgi:hypothetical protein
MRTIAALLAALALATVAAWPSAGGAASTWRPYRISKLGAALDLPRSWSDITRRTPEVERRLKAIQQQNPLLGPSIRSMRASGAIAFLAADLDRSSLRSGFLTNLNVIGAAAPGASIGALRRVLVRELRTAGVHGPIKTRIVSTQAGKALEARYRFEITASATLIRTATTQYYVFHGGKLYVLTYTTAPGERGRYAATFARSGRSFRFGR